MTARRPRSLTALFAVALLLAGCGRSPAPAEHEVAVFQYAEHPALDHITAGIVERLAETDSALIYRVHNAQGDTAAANLIAQQLASGGADVVVVIATPAAQACARHIRNKPVVFAAVTDPTAAGLVRNPEHPGANITGVSDALPARGILSFMRTVMPGMRRLGVLHNPEEVNSAVTVAELERLAQEAGVSIEVAGVASSADVLEAAQHLAPRIDALFMPNDHTVAGAFASIRHVAVQRHVPFFAMDRTYVEMGAAGGVSVDYRALGRQAADMALRVLHGEKPGAIPVETIARIESLLNEEAAARQGLVVPTTVRGQLVTVPDAAAL